MPRPQISVVMPVWNGERYLSEAIQSILTQTFTDFEFVVVDDGSTDRTTEILAGYKDPRLQVFRLAHSGLVPALNLGVEKARGDWIARMDADDISLSRRLETQWKAIHCKPDTVLCHTDAEVIGEKANAVGRIRFPRTQAFLALRLCFQCAITHSTTLFKKETFLAAGGYADEDREAGEDYGLWGRLIERGRVIGIPQKLLKYRMHGASTSTRLLNEQKAAGRRLAAAHCQRFMRLSANDAQKAQAILSTPPHDRQWSDWWWFIANCVPKLRWKSREVCSWLAWQSLKTLL